jgi:hypothetical protein
MTPRYWHAPSLRPVREARRAVWIEDAAGRRIVGYAKDATAARRLIARLIAKHEDEDRAPHALPASVSRVRARERRAPTTGAAIAAAALEAAER